MASNLPLTFFLLFFFLQSLSSNANLHKARLFRSENLSQDPPQDSPTTIFEVTRPIKLPNTKPCSYLYLQHDFGFTYGQPPATAPYNPPSNCPSQNFSKIVMELKAACKGVQFDRIFGVWLGGVEILRSCTAEPSANGIVWTVEKDITRYSSLLKDPQTLAVYLGNLVNEKYTGIYHVNVTFHFYPTEETHHLFSSNSANLDYGFDSPADLILPISRNLPLNDGLWFMIGNSNDIQLKEFMIPSNAYRAVLEVFVSFHENDEFWYENPPNDYITANNLTGWQGNGAFREVVVTLDDKVVGAVWPFTVIYTGGVNPSLWRPITGMGSFDLPSYDIEITPFLGEILDGKQHRFGFGVTNALNVWYIDANLHLWLDGKSAKTMGHLTNYEAMPFKVSLVSNSKGLNGSFLTSTSRQISSTGWVQSSLGNITTHSVQGFDYMNFMVFAKDGNMQTVNQTIVANYSVYAKLPSSDMYTIQVLERFPLYLYTTNTLDQGNSTFPFLTNVSLGFDEDKFWGPQSDFSSSSLSNKQNGQMSIIVMGNLTRILGSTQQSYKYDSTEGCYIRNIDSRNYAILHDESSDICSKKNL